MCNCKYGMSTTSGQQQWGISVLNKPTSFSVPDFDVAVVATAQELWPIVIEADISDSFAMTQKSTKQSSLVVYLPKLWEQNVYYQELTDFKGEEGM